MFFQRCGIKFRKDREGTLPLAISVCAFAGGFNESDQYRTAMPSLKVHKRGKALSWNPCP